MAGQGMQAGWLVGWLAGSLGFDRAGQEGSTAEAN